MTRHDTIARPELTDPTTAAITCTGLTKDYGTGHGVFDLDLAVARSETFGFIGPNGAGVAVLGGLAAAAVAQRTPKVAG